MLFSLLMKLKKPIMSLRPYIALLCTLICLCVSEVVQAAGGGGGNTGSGTKGGGGGGGMGSGGGSTCGSSVRVAAEQVALWMDVNGPGLKNGCAMTGDEFRKLIPLESDFDYVPVTTTLVYKKNPEPSMVLQEDLRTIKIRCDRVNKENGKNPIGFKITSAHEIFRKTKKEGDEFECSKQVLSPKEAAADLAYSLDKQVTIMKFKDDDRVLVKTSVKRNNSELIGFRECPNTAVNEVKVDGNNQISVAFEKCSVVGSNFYKVKDVITLEDALMKKLNDHLEKGQTSKQLAAEAIALGVGMYSNAGLIWASDASAVFGMSRINRFYERAFELLFVQARNHSGMMKTKGFVAAASATFGTFFVLETVYLMERRDDRLTESLKRENIQLSNGYEYSPYGLYLVLNFDGQKISFKSEKNTIIDSLNQLEREKLLKGFDRL